MKKTRNEIRERNGKIVFIIALLTPLIFVALYFAFPFLSVERIEFSPFTDSQDTISQEILPAPSQAFPEYLLGKGQRNLYVGAKQEGETKMVYGITVTALDLGSIQYRIESLKDWRSLPDITGIALLNPQSVQDDHFVISDRNGAMLPAYQFVDRDKKCPIVIGISKTEGYPNSAIAIARKECPPSKVRN